MRPDPSKKITLMPDGRVRVQSVNNEPSRTQQQFADQCDINNIIKKYKQTGELTHLARKQGVFADVSEITDYQTSLNKIAAAQSAFGTLSAQVRLRFNNDPGALLAFMQDPNNYDEAVKLGLVEPKPETNTNDLNEQKTKQAKKTPTKHNTSAPVENAPEDS